MDRLRRWGLEVWGSARGYFAERGATDDGGADASTRMFQGIRRQLTLQYSAILGLILLLSSLLIYVGMRTVLLGPVTGSLAHEAQQQADAWRAGGAPPMSCVDENAHEPLPYLIACFDQTGALIGENPLVNLAPDFAAPALAHAALSDPDQPTVDIPTLSSQVGSQIIQRYTMVVRDATGRQTLGVVQIGLNIGSETHALQTLLILLLAIGALTLLASAVGGLLLSARALAPAHLAFARQQGFIADASHELRTPLTLLRADAEVLLRGRERLDPDDAPLLDDIVAEVEHMGALAENLLTLARLDHGAYHMEQDVVALDELAASVAQRAQALASERGVNIQVVREKQDALLTLGDTTWLREVVLILLDNAIKYNQAQGTVTLRAYRAEAQVALEVRDTGIGIAPEHLRHIGERFYRVDKARSRQMGGSGLGFSIARSIATAHHGTLTLESALGRGTTATLWLPAATLTHAPEAARRW